MPGTALLSVASLVQDPPPSAQQVMLEAQIQVSLDKDLVNLGK